MKHITVKLTEAQAKEVIADLYHRIDELADTEKPKKDLAFVQRIITKISAELVK